MIRAFLLALMPLALIGSCGTVDPGQGPLHVDFGDELAQPYRDILFQAPSLELIATDPDWPTEEGRKDPAKLHGYTVRGRAPLEAREERLELLEALARGARENNGMVAACFNPRHAIRAEWQGEICELIICFECLTFEVWDGEKRVEVVDLSESPSGTFDRLYEAAGLTIAPRGH
ncbi:MAG: hypothetical protein KDB61_00660 [Planctomycetes bacterium]|nr:hypothetical protein [Planctomycetota bacterium]